MGKIEGLCLRKIAECFIGTLLLRSITAFEKMGAQNMIILLMMVMIIIVTKRSWGLGPSLIDPSHVYDSLGPTKVNKHVIKPEAVEQTGQQYGLALEEAACLAMRTGMALLRRRSENFDRYPSWQAVSGRNLCFA